MPTSQEPDETLGLWISRGGTATRCRTTARRVNRRRTGKVTLAKCLQDFCAYLFNVKLPQRFFTMLRSLLGGGNGNRRRKP